MYSRSVLASIGSIVIGRWLPNRVLETNRPADPTKTPTNAGFSSGLERYRISTSLNDVSVPNFSTIFCISTVDPRGAVIVGPLDPVTSSGLTNAAIASATALSGVNWNWWNPSARTSSIRATFASSG